MTRNGIHKCETESNLPDKWLEFDLVMILLTVYSTRVTIESRSGHGSLGFQFLSSVISVMLALWTRPITNIIGSTERLCRTAIENISMCSQ